MSTLLHIDASPRGDSSISRQLSAAAVAAWQAKNPGGKIIRRDLTRSELTFVDLDWIGGAYSPPEQQTETHKKALALSDQLVSEVLAADEIVLGTPMYNFAIPAVLKAWIDHIVRAGKTFQYSSAGPEGLAKGKKAVLAVASGGSYENGSPMAAADHEVPYLRFILNFIGIQDVTFVRAGNTMRVGQGGSAEAFLSPLVEQVRAAV